MYYLQTFQSGRETRRVFSRVGWALAAMLGAELAVQVLVLIPVMLLAPGLMEQGWFVGLFGAVTVYGAAFPVALLVLRTLPKPEHRPAAAPNGRMLGRYAMLCLGGMYLANMVTVTVMELVGVLRGGPVSNPVESMLDQPVWVNLLTACILAPVMEELVFREAVLQRLRPYGDRFAILASALLFGLMHANVYQMLYAFVIGCFFADLILRTGKLRWTMLLHAGINFISAGLLPMIEWLGTAGTMLFGLLVLFCMIFGGILAVGWVSELKERCGKGPEGVTRRFFLNPGMLAFLAVVTWLSALNLMG